MITVKLYQVDSEVASVEFEADIVNIGYVRKMKANGTEISDLKATMDFIKLGSSFLVDQNQAAILKGYFDKVELINGDSVEDVANGRIMMCTGIIARHPTSSHNAADTSNVETVLSLREFSEG